MKSLQIIMLNLFIIMGLLSCSKGDNNNSIENLDATKSYQELNVSYGEHDQQKFDIYLPANRTLDTKIIILVHGGGWSAGDKEDMDAFVTVIQQDFSNIAVVNMNYRLSDDDNQPFPMQTDDITSVINQLKTDREFYTISDEFGFIGASAGAQLSMLWSYVFDTENKVKMVCSIVGPTNFTDPAYLDNLDNPLLQDFFSVFPDQTTKFLESVSPLHQVTASAPPTILFYGGQDPLVPTSQGTDMRDKLAELNVIHQFTLYENEGHGWDGINLLDTWTKLSLFMNDYLI